MKQYKIANLNVDMELYYSRLDAQAKPYLDKHNKADIVINIPVSFYEQKQKENPHLSIDDIEYIFAGSYFYNAILDFDGFLLHSSAIEYENEAYLFSANSGTGKSTHTLNWFKYFGDDKVGYINDDKPAIRKIDGKFYCCGTPFSGKNDLSKNVLVPIRAIIFIKRDETNHMRKLSNKEAINLIFHQTVFTLTNARMNKLLDLLNDLLLNIPIYELSCNMDSESALVCFDFINKDLNNEKA